MLDQQQTTVLMATHDLYRAKDIANTIGIMRRNENTFGSELFTLQFS